MIITINDLVKLRDRIDLNNTTKSSYPMWPENRLALYVFSLLMNYPIPNYAIELYPLKPEKYTHIETKEELLATDQTFILGANGKDELIAIYNYIDGKLLLQKMKKEEGEQLIQKIRTECEQQKNDEKCSYAFELLRADKLTNQLSSFLDLSKHDQNKVKETSVNIILP